MWPHIRNLGALLAGKLFSQSIMTLLGLGLTLGLTAVSIYVGTNKTGEKDAGFFGNIKNAIFTSSVEKENEEDFAYDDYDDEIGTKKEGFFSKLFGGSEHKKKLIVAAKKNEQDDKSNKNTKPVRSPAASVIYGAGINQNSSSTKTTRDIISNKATDSTRESSGHSMKKDK